MKLQITMEDFSGEVREANYNSFKIENSNDDYRLRIQSYSGTAGDALTWLNNQKFSTKDRDHDNCSCNCGEFYDSGWWFNNCMPSNLNGINHDDGIAPNWKGIVWAYNGWSPTTSLKTVTMA